MSGAAQREYNVRIEKWTDEEGKFHRVNIPAVIYTYENGKKYKEWRRHDLFYRYHGEPTKVEVYEDGTKIETWTDTIGKRHRLHGPAVKYTYSDKSTVELWYKHDIPYRNDTGLTKY